jgi:hypothetical protein
VALQVNLALSPIVASTVNCLHHKGDNLDVTTLYFTVKPEEVEFAAPKFIVEIQTVEATIGESAKFTCKATGQPKPQILWFKKTKYKNLNNYIIYC